MRNWSPLQNYMVPLRELPEWRFFTIVNKKHFHPPFKWHENSSSSLSLTPHCFQIYFMSLNVKAIRETARYSLATFIATIGGSMGAWVGFSVCMIFEVRIF